MSAFVFIYDPKVWHLNLRILFVYNLNETSEFLSINYFEKIYIYREREEGGLQLAICILMNLKSSRVNPLSLSSWCTTSTSSGSRSCFLQNHRLKSKIIQLNQIKKLHKKEWKKTQIKERQSSKQIYWCVEVQKLVAIFGDTRDSKGVRLLKKEDDAAGYLSLWALLQFCKPHFLFLIMTFVFSPAQIGLLGFSFSFLFFF